MTDERKRKPRKPAPETVLAFKFAPNGSEPDTTTVTVLPDGSWQMTASPGEALWPRPRR